MQIARSVIATSALLCVAGLCPAAPDAAARDAESARDDRRHASMTVSLQETGRILVGPGRFERTVTITRPQPEVISAFPISLHRCIEGLYFAEQLLTLALDRCLH